MHLEESSILETVMTAVRTQSLSVMILERDQSHLMLSSTLQETKVTFDHDLGRKSLYFAVNVCQNPLLLNEIGQEKWIGGVREDNFRC